MIYNMFFIKFMSLQLMEENVEYVKVEQLNM